MASTAGVKEVIKRKASQLGAMLTSTQTLPVFERDMLDQMRQTGFHPFILVRINGREAQFLVCPTQNEAGQFVQEVNALPDYAASKLLRGIERALQLETWDAGDFFFRWTTEPDAISELGHVGKPAGLHLPTFYGYPAFSIGELTDAPGQAERIAALVDLFNAYDISDGNDDLRFAILGSLALGLSRALGAEGRYREAAAIVERAPAWQAHSIHLKAAKHALALKLAGQEVPPRLEKFIGEDNGALKPYVCSLPFERFDIGPSGDVLVCCGHWLPTSIGNFMRQPIDGILNSPKAMAIRQSVTDGSYKYCNHLECGAMIQGTLPTRGELKSPHAQSALARGDFRVEGIEQAMFAFDQSCNLSCPSCRTTRIVEKMSESVEKARAVEEKLLPLLPSLRVLHINPAGELFASKPSRRLLELINDERCPELRLDIISNGTLFTEDEWNKFPGIHNKVRSVRISIDAARKETFEKLRRLGKYEPFLRNMEFLSRLRTGGTIPQLKFSFTYQLDNFREMCAFVEFCERMNADFAIFERLQKLALTGEEFKDKAVHQPSHPLYREFIDVVRDPIFRAKRVWHDFDFPGVEKMSEEEALERSQAARLG
jgi:hypothetical protein